MNKEMKARYKIEEQTLGPIERLVLGSLPRLSRSLSLASFVRQ